LIATPIDTVAWNSRWRLRSVAEKATLCGGLLACAVLLPPWPAAPLVVLVVFVAAGFADVPRVRLLRMLCIPLVFILVAGMSTAVTLDPSGPHLTTSADAVIRAGEAVARAVSATAAVMFLAAVTPMSEITDSMRRAGLPAACADLITVMYRMIFLLLESVAVVRKSQTARLGYSTVPRSVRSAGLMTAAVLVRSWRRAHALDRGLSGRNLGMPVARPDKPRVSVRFIALAALTNLSIVLAALLMVVLA
jgi:cobalt/nickel transport system permease protein